MNKLKKLLNTRIGFFSLAAVLFWAKTYFSYKQEFSLGVTGAMQQIILFINPIATIALFFSIALYFKKSKKAYTVLFLVHIVMSALLFANILYYREFSDFLSVTTIFGAGNVAGGLGASTLALLKARDIFYWLDLVVLLGLLVTKSVTIDNRFYKKRSAVAMTILAVTLFSANLALAESNRPQLLTRTFDRNYIVKYLGINFFTAYDGYQTAQSNQNKANADESDMDAVLSYVDEHYAEPNPEMFGVAKDKNVIYLHLESFQQFLIDYKLEDENGELHEVTPFINSIFRDQQTQSFTNVFHQVGQGKTADSEMILENSLFGLPQGGAFTQVGGSNTFQSSYNILESEKGYTSAVMHGNVGSFWNRDNTYKQMGVDYFFDSSYYDLSEGNTLEYGLKDKLFFNESAQYLEQLPQPFYAKMISVSNHFPYPLDEANVDFKPARTTDETVNNYFITAHYLDQAVEEFFNYLKASGLYENSMIILYGDHYGISNSRNKALAPLLGEDPETWNGYKDDMLQRIPLMYHIPGTTNGKINEEFGGQIDMLPTMMHLLGIQTKDKVMMGTDLFSAGHDQTVAFRNGNVVSPKYTLNGSDIYDTVTGQLIEEPSQAVLLEQEQLKEAVSTQLSLSDSILHSDLLRFYTPAGLNKIDPSSYSYQNQIERMAKINSESGDKATSLYYLNGNRSTADLYQTNAPELMEPTDSEIKTND
ncbi:lipoteichoic acid synthase [Carnobacterium iners]|uniref:Lipoteichoic acid synthase n=1 Tax=Carnobacterium iners TaxID=1073423 RepID=A0A1X7N6E2_9LACT|nr:LTA synthase family protein [Carnobacterium iners]SEK45573.1 lipoteichoic acid synthase [Carnobacterium iners]SMH32937.1 lipoteichoic acid synthase [Carnobacterium iners]